MAWTTEKLQKPVIVRIEIEKASGRIQHLLQVLMMDLGRTTKGVRSTREHDYHHDQHGAARLSKAVFRGRR